MVADVKPIVRILSQHGQINKFEMGNPPMAEDRIRGLLRDVLEAPNQGIQVAVISSGLVVGYLHWLVVPTFSLPHHEIYINQLFVTTDHLNQGAATGLLQSVKQQAIQKNASRIRIEICDQPGAHEFIQNRGFQGISGTSYQQALD